MVACGDDEATVLKTAFGWYEMGVEFTCMRPAYLLGGHRSSVVNTLWGGPIATVTIATQ